MPPIEAKQETYDSKLEREALAGVQKGPVVEALVPYYAIFHC